MAEGILLDALSLPGLMGTAVGISRTRAMKPRWHVLAPQMHPAENTHFCYMQSLPVHNTFKCVTAEQGNCGFIS